MAEINSDRLKQILAGTVGPAPWYWKTFPEIDSAGRRFAWSHHGEEGALAHLVTLNVEEQRDQPLLALNTYCRPFIIPPSRFGVWCPEGRSIRLAAFDPGELKPFDLAEIAGWFKQSSDRIYATTAPIAEFEIPLGFSAGMHKIEVPAELRSVDEVIVPTSLLARVMTIPHSRCTFSICRLGCWKSCRRNGSRRANMRSGNNGSRE